MPLHLLPRLCPLCQDDTITGHGRRLRQAHDDRGYDIFNTDSMNYLLLNDSYVSGGLSTGVYGNYMDYIAPQSIAIGPGDDSGPVAFNMGTAGVGEFDFNPFVPIPTSIPGFVVRRNQPSARMQYLRYSSF